ncbi:unnamed protein product [Acanthoscelides obtectus]|uniref:Uncharacterized protein n=1 Tax=Acanthoscelides obtectus TaxID=200917 RepID=A0A9P0JVY3_ACAOB|nr:unnamed protein product [Acanthoscelides obtectus]CAK1637511.1 hypothetical protein AOBTE_LOCUS10011 [Acanthoscelides obtectus]
MNSLRRWPEKKPSTKEKKLSKLIHEKTESGDEIEHELSYYINDRVKLIKEVLKIIKPKKIRSMAPQFMRNMENEEINSMLLEELLGISNKRLKYIFNGMNLEEDSSSTDPEDDQKPIDVISLDDISDDALEDVIDLDSDKESKRRRCRKHRHKIKEEPQPKKVKKEKQAKPDKEIPEKGKTAEDKSDNPVNEQNLMSVLELLELQARARAIRSQLALESNKKQEKEKKKAQEKEVAQDQDDGDDDAVIIELPKNEEIVITSSESENEDGEKKKGDAMNGEDHFWKGQKPTNGSFYGNSEGGTNAREDSDTQPSVEAVSQEVESGNNSKATTSGKSVVIQQVEIIRSADSSDKANSKDVASIPLPAVEDKETSSKEDGINSENPMTVDNENLKDASKVDGTNQDSEEDENAKKQASSTNTRSEEDSENGNVPDILQNSNSGKVKEVTLDQDSNIKEVDSNKSRIEDMEKIVEKHEKAEDKVCVDADPSTDQSSKVASNKDGQFSKVTTKKKQNKRGDIENENLTKAKDTGKPETTVGKTSEKVADSSRTGEPSSKGSLGKTKPKKEDAKGKCDQKPQTKNQGSLEKEEAKGDKKSENKDEGIKVKSDSKSQSSESEKNDVSPKKTKGKCKRKIAIRKTTLTTGEEEGSEKEKTSNKKQKLDKKSTEKHNTDDNEDIH